MVNKAQNGRDPARGGYQDARRGVVSAVSTQNKKKTFLKNFPKNKKKFTKTY